MDTIDLRGLTFYGYHGAYPEEQRLGQRFVIDLRLGLDLGPAGRSDDLGQSVDYGQVVRAVREIVEGPPFKLIEALAEAVAAAVLARHPLVSQVDVRVAKPSAPVAAAPTGLVAVEISRRRANDESADNPSRGASQRTAPASEGAPPPAGSVLSAEGIRALLTEEPPLVTPLADPDQQIQPNGIDLTLESVWRLEGAGAIGVSNGERRLPDRSPLAPDETGWFALPPGTYLIRFREVVALPADLMAFGRSRSSLLRCGAAIHTAVWDAGYRGRSEALLVVYAEAGVRLEAGARVLQLVFVRLASATRPYAGAYQGENLPIS